MNDSTKDKVQGALHEARGAVKEKLSHVSNHPGTETEALTRKSARDSKPGREHRKSSQLSNNEGSSPRFLIYT
jgi:hypothetical protein